MKTARTKMWVLQHAAPETLGTIASALRAAGHSYEYVRTFEGAPVPKNMEGADGLIVMGGPMGVYDHSRYPYLKDEMRLIETALKEKKPVLGTCLGSQLLAAVLGAPVTKGKKKEIGWHPVTLRKAAASDPLWKGVPPSFMGFHWHGDIFELPKGAVSLASSLTTEHQAFRWGENAYGLLFHMEVTEPMIRQMTETFADELRQEKLSGREILQETSQHQPELQKIGSAVYGRWAELLSCRSPRPFMMT
ncbi:MAG: gamma-glutamyl-gamma-aminobutyrate hydrolase family protein [Candidatus Omnitrophica bacterium]|nr:gamma-glutamyl-gamma-aminobutyrate hydrolase family protein [Candidatus Omnitrophota bacterium]